MSEKIPSLLDRSVNERRQTLWDRILNEPKYMIGSVGAVGLAVVLAWTFMPALMPDDLSSGGDGAVFDSRNAATGEKSGSRRKRRSRRLSIIPMDMASEESESAAQAAAPAPSGPGSTAMVSAPQGSAETPGMETQTLAAAPGVGPSEPAAVSDAFRAEGTLDKKAFGGRKSGGYGGAGGGAGAAGGPGALGGSVPSASADKTAITASLSRVVALGPSGARVGGGQMRAGSGFSDSGQGAAIAGAGLRQAGASIGAARPGGTTGDGSDSGANAITGASSGQLGGGAGLPSAPEAIAGGGSGEAKSGGGGGGGGVGGGSGNEGGEAQATEQDLMQAAAIFAAQADALEADAGRPAVQEVARMTDATADAAAGAIGDLNAFYGRVESDRTYFNVTYKQPEIVSPLDSVDEALTDSQDGIVTRLQSSDQRLSSASGCLKQFASGTLSLKTEMTKVVGCMKTAEGGMDQRERDLKKVMGLKRAVDRWSTTAVNSVKGKCPLPAKQPTPDEKPHCDALNQLEASASFHETKLGSAQSRLNTVQPDANVSNQLPGTISSKRDIVAERRRMLDDLVLPPGTPSAILRGQLADAILNLDFASGWWRKVAAGSVAAEERAGEASRATGKLVTAIVSLREASRVAGILAKHAPKQK